MISDKRFYYNRELEHALRQVFPKKYNRDAGLFANPTYVKKATLDWIERIKKRVFELTEYDLRLREMVFMDLDSIKEEIKNISKEPNEWKIIPKLMMVISRLLGYDWCDGTVNREVFYKQNIAQEHKDLIARGRAKPIMERIKFQSNINQTLFKTINYLEKEGYEKEQISMIINKSYSTIDRIKKRYGKCKKI